jgi:hypothetical protein
LRRYYLRRVWADLRLSEIPPGELQISLQGLGEAIRMQAVKADIEGQLKDALPPSRTLRAPPADDAQLMFFVPSIYDAPIKDNINLMDVAPFSLSKNRKTGTLRYELKDCLITVTGSSEYGLATVFDYDIFINMTSYLVEEMRRYRQDEAKGLRPSMPPKVFRPSAAHILKFCRRSTGGKAYKDLEAARSSKSAILPMANAIRSTLGHLSSAMVW